MMNQIGPYTPLMEKMMKSKGTVKSGGERKFPIASKAQARNAMARLNQAKPPLTSEQRKTVARAAQRKLGHSTPKIKQVLKR